jgi:hypothetical protein
LDGPVVRSNPVLNQDLFFSAGNATFTSGAGGPFTYRLTGSGGSDANITGGTLTLGTGINPLNLTVDDDLVVRGGATLNVNSGSVVNTRDLVLAFCWLIRVLIEGVAVLKRIERPWLRSGERWWRRWCFRPRSCPMRGCTERSRCRRRWRSSRGSVIWQMASRRLYW